MAISRLEDMSNELFYEIFVYLDGCDVTQAFFNLNTRFRCLIQNPPLLFKIKLCPDSKSEVHGARKQVMVPYKNQILSLHLSDHLVINRFFILNPIDSSFDRLESLSLHFIRKDQLSLLDSFSRLTRLIRLIIYLDNDTTDLTAVYYPIFNLPVLKYSKISFLQSENLLMLPLNISPQQSNSIEYLVIDHPCTINDLSIIFLYAPQLRRLSFKKSLSLSLRTQSSLTLSNLTHLYIYKCAMDFDTFEIFTTKISSQLQVLKLCTVNCPSYLDADRWERLISQNMPQLRNFYFKYHESFNNNYQLTTHHQLLNRFTWSFWTDRQWIFGVIFDHREINYSIQPYRYEKRN